MKTLTTVKVRPFVLENANVYVPGSEAVVYGRSSRPSGGGCCGPVSCCGSATENSEQKSTCDDAESSSASNDSGQCGSSNSASESKQQVGCCG